MTAWMKGKNPAARVKKEKERKKGPALIPIIAVLVHRDSENRQLSSQSAIAFPYVEQDEKETKKERNTK